MLKKTIIEKRFYISSLVVNIELFSKAIRNHWSVENKLHWHLDFTFREDKNTTMNKNALINLQIINKFCLGILNKIKSFHDNVSLRRIRKRMQMNFEKWLILYNIKSTYFIFFKFSLFFIDIFILINRRK